MLGLRSRVLGLVVVVGGCFFPGGGEGGSRRWVCGWVAGWGMGLDGLRRMVRLGAYGLCRWSFGVSCCPGVEERGEGCCCDGSGHDGALGIVSYAG